MSEVYDSVRHTKYKAGSLDIITLEVEHGNETDDAQSFRPNERVLGHAGDEDTP